VVAQAVSAVALVLLAASGAFKFIQPDPTIGAMRAVGLPSSRLIVRLLAVAEMTAAVTALALGSVWLVGAGVLYLGFFLFTLTALRRRLPIQSCGCFGREDTPPTWFHAGFNGLSALSLWYLVAVNGTAVPWLDPPLQVTFYLIFSLIGGYLAYLLLTLVPRTLGIASTR